MWLKRKCVWLSIITAFSMARGDDMKADKQSNQHHGKRSPQHLEPINIMDSFQNLIENSPFKAKQNENSKAADDIQSLRDLIQKSSHLPEVSRDVSDKALNEVESLRDRLDDFERPTKLLSRLENILKEAPVGEDSELAQAIEDPMINVIDSEISEFIKTNRSKSKPHRKGYQPNLDEVKRVSIKNQKTKETRNLYREHLEVTSIHEEEHFEFGVGVEEWKVIRSQINQTAIIGRSSTNVVLIVGHGDTYELIKTIDYDVVAEDSLRIATLKIWDDNQNRVRYLALVTFKGQLLWYELIEDDLVEIQRWNLLKEIVSLCHFTHDDSEILLVTTIDEAGKVHAEFIEFSVPDNEFWVIQAFPLDARPDSVATLPMSREVIIAFVVNNNVLIYEHEFSKHLRGRFILTNTIQGSNVSAVSGFRIGGNSYLAIGGDQPQILRYSDNDFLPLTILGQSFGYVEEFLPIPVKTYRDDLILLVQHRINLGTHSLPIVDALIWNGVAFENALSVPCKIPDDPNANGFTCMIDLDREEGLLGGTFIHHEKENGLFIIVPRHEAHSGMYHVNYKIVESEDPLAKEFEHAKKSIELINDMLDYEEDVKEEIDEVLKDSINPKNDFHFENLHHIEELEAEILEFDGNVELAKDVIEFLDVSWTLEDFLVNLDEIEATITADEMKLKMIDDEINKVNRIHRQVEQFSKEDSPIIRLPFPSNGQPDPSTVHVLPQSPPRPRRQIEPIEESTVSSLTVKDLQVQMINGVPVDDFLFVDANGQLILPEANITFLDSVEVDNANVFKDGRVNNIDFSNDVITVESLNSRRNLHFKDIMVQNLEVGTLNDLPVDLESLEKIDLVTDTPVSFAAESVVIKDNLNVETINGIAWNDYISKLVPKHKDSTVDSIIVDGDVVVIGESGQLNVNYLNELPFPDEFVLKDGPRETVITGRKTFKGELLTTAVDTDGTINGIVPSDMITLDQDQVIHADTTFNEVEVIKKLEVNGTIAGRQLQEFLPNPTLVDVKVIDAACSFRELIVEGVVKIENSLDGQNLMKVLQDVVYESPDGSDVFINASKTFRNLEVVGDINIVSNFINDINLDEILMTDRDQVVTFNKLNGHVYISNLIVDGLFDGVNVTELELNSIRTFGDQFIESPLIISKGNLVEGSSIEIKESLNGVSVGDYLYVDEPIDLTFMDETSFDDLRVGNLKVDGDVVGSGSLVNFNISDISRNYLSKSLPQKILAPTRIQSLTTSETFQAKTINGMDFEVFKNYMLGIKNFKTSLLSGEQTLDNLIVNGNVFVKKINGEDFNNLVDNVIWLNRPNNIDGHLRFHDEVTVDGSMIIQGNLNGKSFKEFTENWISNKDESIVLHSNVAFQKDVIVEENLQTDSINNIKFDNIFFSSDIVNVPQLIVDGNVLVDDLNVVESFNQQKMKEIEDLYSYDIATDTHIVHSDVHFNQPVQTLSLKTPFINNLNVSLWLSNLIRLDESQVYITGPKIFNGPIIAQQGFYSEVINGINLKFLDHVILTNNQAMVQINGNLQFNDEVYAQIVALKNDLITDFISNCDPKEWLRNSLPIDRNVVLNGVLRIKAEALNSDIPHADYINNIPFSHFFTLATNQTFDDEIKVFGSVNVVGPLIVHGKVNGYDLRHERDNTVMRNEKHQEIKVKTSFAGANVLESMNTMGKINSKDLRHVALLNSSVFIKSAASLKSLEASSLYTDDLISGINFNKWYDNVLWVNGRQEQTIHGEWRVKKLRFSDDVVGNGLINNMSINHVESNLRQSLSSIDAAITNHTSQFEELCNKLSAKANDTQHSIHFLKHFEMDFKIKESDDIFSYFTFETSSLHHILIVNTNCTSHVYKWDKASERFKKVQKVVTGVVYNWEKVKNNNDDELFIITNSRMEANIPCQFGGINVWKMNDNQMFHVSTIRKGADVNEIHVTNQLPGRFFALDNLDVVTHYDILGEKKEFWQLPNKEHFNYTFLPSKVSHDVTLYNGRKLFVLESKFKKRSTRFLWQDKVEMNKGKSRPNDQTGYNIRVPDTGRKNYLPSIPSKPLTPVVGETRKSFVSKCKEVGEALRKSIRDTFGNVPKLKVKNAITKSAENEELETESKDQQGIGGFLQDVKEIGKAMKFFLTVPPGVKFANDKDEKSTENKSKESSLKKENKETEQVTISSTLSYDSSTSEFSENDNSESVTSADAKENVQETSTVTTSKDTESTEKLEEEIDTKVNQKSEENDELADDGNEIEDSDDLSRGDVLPEVESSNHDEESIEVTPRIILPEGQEHSSTDSNSSTKLQDETKVEAEQEVPHKILNGIETDDSQTATTDSTSPTEELPDEVKAEQEVPHKILSGSGIIEAENSYFPEHGSGEFIMMHVGPRYQRRPLYAVTRTRDSTIKGNHNLIEIYNDIFEGSIYQYIHCTEPSNLVSIEFHDETLLVFLESRIEIQAYIYRGIQGFVPFKRVKLPSFAAQMTSLTLPPKIEYKCDHHYLIVRIENQLVFYDVKTAGNCGLRHVKCTEK